MEIIQTIHQIVTGLNKENISKSINSIIKIFDYKHPFSFNQVISYMISILCATSIDFDVYLNFMKEIESFQEKNNISSKISDVFSIVLISNNDNTMYYPFMRMYEEKLGDPKILKENPYLFQYMSKTEIQKYKNRYEFKEIFDNFQELSKNDWALHKKYIKEGHNPSEIAKIIRNDDIEKLQEISSQNNFDFNQLIKPSIYERCLFLNEQYVTLIDYAAFFAAIKCFKYLLMNGSKIDDTGKFAVAGGNIEIIHLCEQNHSSFIDAYETAIILYKNDVFKYLYENEIVEFRSRKDLVILSIMNGNNEIFAFLQEKGVKISDRIIDILASIGNFYLVKHFIKVNKMPYDILVCAAESKNIELVKYLLKKKGIEINAQNINGKTALMSASSNGNIEIIKLLLEQEGIDINAKNKYGQTALNLAAFDVKTDIAKLLSAYKK